MTAKLEKNNEITNTDAVALSEKETKKYLTPFAFKMDKSLFGLPLASPTKRGIALLIDFGLIALLSEVSGVALALAIAVTLYYLGNKKRALNSNKKRGHKRRKIMRFVAAFMVFIVLLDTIPPLLKYFSAEEAESQLSDPDNSFSFPNSVALTATELSAIKTIADSDCEKLNCWQAELGTVAEQAATVSYERDIKLSKAQFHETFSNFTEEIELSSNEQEQLVESMYDSFNKKFSNLVTDNKKSLYVEKPSETTTLLADEIPQVDQNKDTVYVDGEGEKLAGDEQLKEEKTKKPVYSVIKWVKGIIEDLGLGFGWATFYFTAFIALGKGQTIGKKLLGIKVLQLDGTPLSLWDSFERYGGYGAGLATGLLGFIQIYWDPNKQAIHDRISATVVIDLKKPRLSHNIIGSNSAEK
jgi:hypothetical protein